MKRVLITGVGSFVGTSVQHYLEEFPDQYTVESVSTENDYWKHFDFSSFDVVYHVAGLAHSDVGKVTEEIKRKYYVVNTNLAVEVAQKAKAEGVKQFIFMSSSIVYGDSAPIGEEKIITSDTPYKPVNFYGDSKVQAEKQLLPLQDGQFKVVILRCPMIYGKGGKGNFPVLERIARQVHFFPKVQNARSMLFIDNLAEFVRLMIENEESGVFWPCNREQSNTSELVRMIGKCHGRQIKLIPGCGQLLKALSLVTGYVNKAFGNFVYAQGLGDYKEDYRLYSLAESIEKTEETMKTVWIIDHYSSEPKYGGIQRQFDFANELSKRGYRTVIVSSAFSHYTHTYISEEGCHFSQFAENAHYAYVHTRPYERNGGIGRVRNMFSFVGSVRRNRKMIETRLGKPDVVVGASVHPLAWVAAYRIAKRYKVRFVVEVRDLWPEMWLLNGEKSRLDPMVVFFGSLEKWAYKKADKIIYSMLYGDRYICGKLGFPKDKVALIGQPMDCERFDRNAAEKSNEVPQVIKDFVENSFTCVFTGYFMEYEGVHVMLRAAKAFHDRQLPIKFLFIGSGQEEKRMREYVEDNNLDNVLIHGRISKELIPAILRLCDVCLAHCATEGKEESFKYGISKNKVNEYLYSGNPVIYGRDDVDDPVAKHGGGLVIKPFKPEQFESAIEEIYRMNPELRAGFGERGMSYIVKYHRVDSLVDQLVRVLGI